MILFELYEKSPESYQDLENDNTQPQMGQLRKTRLTLKQISKLRQMNDIRKIEHKNKLKYVKAQYSPPVEPAGPPM